MKVLILSIAAALALSAQPASLAHYSATCTLTLSGSAQACTIQQPASGARTIQLKSVYVHTTAAVNLTQERNGTAATSTAVTVRPANPEAGAAVATAFTNSNVGVGTLVTDADAIKLAANEWTILDVSAVQLKGSSTAINYSVRTSAATGTVTIITSWQEY